MCSDRGVLVSASASSSISPELEVEVGAIGSPSVEIEGVNWEETPSRRAPAGTRDSVVWITGSGREKQAFVDLVELLSRE